MANSYSNYAIIRVTPTLTEDSAYADGDVLFTATEIPNAVLGNGGCSMVLGAYILDQDKDTVQVDFIFHENNINIGTQHATANIDDDNLQALGICSVLKYKSSANVVSDLDAAYIGQCMPLSDTNESTGGGHLIQAASDSTSVFVSGLITSGTPTFADTDDIDLILHIQYR